MIPFDGSANEADSWTTSSLRNLITTHEHMRAQINHNNTAA